MIFQNSSIAAQQTVAHRGHGCEIARSAMAYRAAARLPSAWLTNSAQLRICEGAVPGPELTLSMGCHIAHHSPSAAGAAHSSAARAIVRRRFFHCGRFHRRDDRVGDSTSTFVSDPPMGIDAVLCGMTAVSAPQPDRRGRLRSPHSFTQSIAAQGPMGYGLPRRQIWILHCQMYRATNTSSVNERGVIFDDRDVSVCSALAVPATS